MRAGALVFPALVAAVLAPVALLSLHAASPVFWRVATQDDFLRGDADNISIDAGGQLLLGPNAEVVHETTVPFVWSLAQAEGALWAGGGTGGVVYRVQPDGGAATLLEAGEFDVHALAPDGRGGVYAATSPDGRVVALDTDGAVREVFDPEEPYIWSLARGDDGALFVGTGSPGRIYRVPPESGDAALLYDTGATHVRSLAIDAGGHVIAGTGSPGQVFRIEGDGTAFVLLDSGRDEITALRTSEDDAILAIAVGPPGSAGDSSPAPAAARAAATVSTSVSVTVTGSATTATAAPSVAPTPTATGGSRTAITGGAIYLIAADGIWDVVWESTTDVPYDAIRDAGGDWILGTGPSGKIFRVTADPTAAVLLTRAPARQVTRLVDGADGRLYFATANPGAVYRLAAGHAGEGTYLSEVHDAQTVAAWGTIRWRSSTPAGSSVRLHTRTGNTATPSDTWSPWSDPYDAASGTAITSPKARYLQWKAVLRGDGASPALLSVTSAYLPRNLAPTITSITLHPPGRVFQQTLGAGDPPIAGLNAGRDPTAVPAGAGVAAAAQTPTLGRQVYRKGLQAIAWQARDPNQDLLRFEVWYRAEGGGDWRMLEQELDEALFTWDTTSVPDGTYVARIVASDAETNAPGDALAATRDSSPFDVDNTPPGIDIEGTTSSGDQAVVRLTVSDAQSTIERLEYTLDAERWQIVYPVDGIPDAREERFEVAVPVDALDRLVLRATDAMDNTATAAGR